MANHTLDGSNAAVWKIDDNNDTWTLQETGSIHVGFSLGEFFGIDEAAQQSGNVIRVKGDVTADGAWGQAAIRIAGSETRITIFDGATLQSNTGIISTAVDAVIHNDGIINAAIGIDETGGQKVTNLGEINGTTGISSGGGTEIINSGQIHSTMAGIFAESGGTTIRNLEGGVIDGATTGIDILGPGSSRIVNAGEITGGVTDGEGDLRLINTGRLVGDSYLGAGLDIFDTRNGAFIGTVHGEAGDDVYKVSSKNVAIVEEFGEGHDKVISSATFMLPEFVEELILTGSKNATGIGGFGANIVTGNRGNNYLYGNPGDDVIDGGAGDDHLIGGMDEDTFVFRMGSGHDLIEDFADAEDLLSFAFVKNAADIKDLFENHLEQRDDDLFITYGKDQVIIKNLDAEDLGKDNFALA